jgi:hypothetical protein
MKKIYKSRMARKSLRKLQTVKNVASSGKIFSVEFTKKDGSSRKMTCRLGVKKHLRGGRNTVRHIKKYVTVFSMADKGYRNVNIQTLKTVKGSGQVFNF